jgi:hypothetical protein
LSFQQARLESKSLDGETGLLALGQLEIELLLSLHFTPLTRALIEGRIHTAWKFLVQVAYLYTTRDYLYIHGLALPAATTPTTYSEKEIERQDSVERATHIGQELGQSREQRPDQEDVGRKETCLLRELTAGEARKARCERERSRNDQWLKQYCSHTRGKSIRANGFFLQLTAKAAILKAQALIFAIEQGNRAAGLQASVMELTGKVSLHVKDV